MRTPTEAIEQIIDRVPQCPALTPQERVILTVIASTGEENVRIAKTLALAEKTVKNHINGINRKLGTRNRADMLVKLLHAALRDHPSGQPLTRWEHRGAPRRGITTTKRRGTA